MKVITDDIRVYDSSWWNMRWTRIKRRLRKYYSLPGYMGKVWPKIAERIGERSVLEFGCGPGLFSQFVKGHYIGVDWSAEAIKQAQARFPKRLFFADDFQNIGIKADVCVAFELFEHLEKPQELVAHMLICAPVAILSCPSEWWGEKVIRKAQRPGQHTRYHYATYNQGDIRAMFPGVKFLFADRQHYFFEIAR